MAYAIFHGAFEQRARIDGVVAIVSERVANQVGDHDRGGKVDDGLDLVFGGSAERPALGRRCRRRRGTP